MLFKLLLSFVRVATKKPGVKQTFLSKSVQEKMRTNFKKKIFEIFLQTLVRVFIFKKGMNNFQKIL